MTGKVREWVSGDLIAPMLPTGFEVASGKIVDYLGNQSSETDVIIHNPTVLPPILYTEKDGVFPVESSYYAMEVKSKFPLRQ